MKILNLNQSLADEDHLCDFGDAGDPGVANQLRIQSQQSIRFLCVAAGSGLPLDQAAGAVQLSDRVDVGYEVILFGNGSHELDLQVAARLANADAVVLAEPLYELDSLAAACGPKCRRASTVSRGSGRQSIPETGRPVHLRRGSRQPGRVRRLA